MTSQSSTDIARGQDRRTRALMFLREVRVSLVLATVSIVIMVLLGLLTQDAFWSGVIDRGVASGVAIVGFIAAVGGLVSGSKALRADNMSYQEVGASGIAGLVGAALVLVGTVAKPA